MYAKSFWPKTIKRFQFHTLNESSIPFLLTVLAKKEVEAIVLPFFDLLEAGRGWPVPLKEKNNIESLALKLIESSLVTVDRTSYFIIIRPKKELNESLLNTKYPITYPIIIGADPFRIERILGDGWYACESPFIWSSERASLFLPLPQECQTKRCELVLSFYVHGLSDERPQKVDVFRREDSKTLFSLEAKSNSSLHNLSIPVLSRKSTQELTLDIPKALSPKDVNPSSGDSRLLGVALYSIDLVIKP